MLLVSGGASKTQVHPIGLCEAMAEGMSRQIEHDEWGVVNVKMMSTKGNVSESPVHEEGAQCRRKAQMTKIQGHR